MQNKNNDISDKEIISLFNERSEQAISKTSDKYKNLCFKIADNILNDKRDSEECVSDTWLAPWNNIPPKSPNPLKAYICRIVKNLSLKRYEYNSAGKRKSEYEVSLDELNDCLDKNNDTLKQIEQKQLIETINVFLKKLPKEKRILFIKRYWFMESVKQLAKDYKISETGISMRLSRIRSELKSHLIKEGYYD